MFRQKEDKYWQRENAHPDGPPIPFQSKIGREFRAAIPNPVLTKEKMDQFIGAVEPNGFAGT